MRLSTCKPLGNKLAFPPQADLDLYCRLANGQRRHCEALGWERTARDVTLDLKQYLAATAKDEDK